MLAFAAILFFYVLSVLLIAGLTRKKKVRLGTVEIALLFGLKVAMGCAYGYIFQRYFGGDDTWMLHHGSLQEYQKLMREPGQFLADLDPTASFRRNDGLANGWYFLLSDLEFWTITKPLALFNVLSRGNYYVNVVFFNLLTFWGQYLLFKLFAARWPHRRRLVLALVFLVPSVTFWLSGIRPDAWIMVSIGLGLYYFHAWLQDRRLVHLLWAACGLAGLIIFRSPLLLVLLPGLLSWLIVERSRRPAWKVFTIIYGAGVILFFASAFILPDNNMLTYVAHRQEEFKALKGNTVFELNTLEPTPASFISTLPQAFANTFLRPYVWEARGVFQWMAAIETIFFWLLLFLALRRRPDNYSMRQPVFWLAVFFGVGLYLFIGFTVPFPGAIVRYKVIPELLLLLAIFLRPKSH
jgi:hypothetical protein